MRKKNYFQPTMKPYKLKAARIMAASAPQRSFSVPEKNPDDSDDQDATQAFTSRDAF